MSDLQNLTDEFMQDPKFVKEYEAIQPEINITRAILDARINAGMTQMELSQKSGFSPGGSENYCPGFLMRLRVGLL